MEFQLFLQRKMPSLNWNRTHVLTFVWQQLNTEFEVIKQLRYVVALLQLLIFFVFTMLLIDEKLVILEYWKYFKKIYYIDCGMKPSTGWTSSYHFLYIKIMQKYFHLRFASIEHQRKCSKCRRCRRCWNK